MKWNLEKKKTALNLEENIKDQISQSIPDNYIWTFAIDKFM